MKTYGLYLESGPKHMKTMAHVLDLLGCIATGATTDAAVAATPEAIRNYLLFMHTNGERVDPDAAFNTKVVEHILARFHAMREALASWAESRTAKQLDAVPQGGGRSGRAILFHVLSGPGGYLSAALGGAKGFSAVQGAAERGEITLAEGLRRIDVMARELVRGTTQEQRKTVVRRPKEIRTLRKALRRMLEHDWEHLAELSRRAGGPSW